MSDLDPYLHRLLYKLTKHGFAVTFGEDPEEGWMTVGLYHESNVDDDIVTRCQPHTVAQALLAAVDERLNLH